MRIMGRGTGEAELRRGRSGLATGAEQAELIVRELIVLNGQSTTKFISIVMYKNTSQPSSQIKDACIKRLDTCISIWAAVGIK